MRLGGKNKTILPDYSVKEWGGLNTRIKDLRQLKDGQSPDSKNWITGKYKDHIELRRGYKLLGTTRNNGTGRITGLGVGSQQNGTQVPFFTYDQKIKYYSATLDDTVEIGTDSLPVAEDMSVMPYENISGSYVYMTSPKTSIYQIPVATPTLVDLKSTSFRGRAKVGQNRMFLWQRNDTYNQAYLNQLYLSVSDITDITQYTQTTKESVGAGDGSTTAFSGTLAFKANNSKATAFNTEFASAIQGSVSLANITKAVNAVVTMSSVAGLSVGDAVLISSVSGMTEINNLIGIILSISGNDVTISIDSTTFTDYSSGGAMAKAEYFIDDKNGGLYSSLGGTGTINYATGAFTLSFNTAPLSSNAVYAQYYVSDSTSNGIADFTIVGGTKGKGKLYLQADGAGDIQAVFPFDQVEYCFHLLKAWYLTLGADDTSATNLPYRSDMGIPYFQAGYSTDDGVLFLDFSNPADPKVKILQVNSQSTAGVVTVVPYSISDVLDLSTYGFSQAVMFRYGEYDILACAGSLNGITQSNNTAFFIRNIVSDQWDLLDYCVSSLDAFLGTLLSGDSLSNNCFTLFSGFDDDGNLIDNYWKSKRFNLGVEGTKRWNRAVVKGLIQSSQSVDVYASYDSGSPIKIFTIDGSGSYVNKGVSVTVGSSTVGSNVIGGGGDVFTAYSFEIDTAINSDVFEDVQLTFKATNIGYVQIDEFIFRDLRYKGRKSLQTYITN